LAIQVPGMQKKIVQSAIPHCVMS